MSVTITWRRMVVPAIAVLVAWLMAVVVVAAADETVQVKTADPVRVEGTKDSSSEGLATKWANALKNAAKDEKHAKVKKDEEEMAADKKGLGEQAKAVIDALKGGDDAVTFDHVTVNGNTIIVINIETLPPDAPKMLKEHEDGHAFINNEIAKKVGPGLVAKYKGKKDADDLVTDAIDKAQRIAQRIYEDATNHGMQGNQHEEAEKAIKQALEELKQTGSAPRCQGHALLADIYSGQAHQLVADFTCRKSSAGFSLVLPSGYQFTSGEASNNTTQNAYTCSERSTHGPHDTVNCAGTVPPNSTSYVQTGTSPNPRAGMRLQFNAALTNGSRSSFTVTSH